MKKFTCRMMALLLCMVFVVSGCTGENKEEKKTETKKEVAAKSKELVVSAPGEFPIVNEKVEMDVFAVVETYVEDLEENYQTKYVEDLTGVKINWTTAPQDFSDKLNLMLASGDDLPDVIMGNRVLSKEQATIYGDRGMFIDLTDLIEEHGYYIKKLFEDEPMLEKTLRTSEGKIYGLSGYAVTYHTLGQYKLWINQTWLDNLDLKMPNTPDEYYKVLKAFKEKDANGNGDPNDEIPLIASKNAWRSDLTGFLMNAFTLSTGANWDYMYVEDDEIKVAYTQDGFREGLEFLNKLYEEGLLDDESFTLDKNQLLMLTGDENGNRIGSVPCGAISEFVNLSSDVAKEFVAVEPLEDKNGVRRTPKIQNMGEKISFAITKDCENPEVAIKWADARLANPASDLELWMPAHYGPEGENWRLADDGEKALDGSEAWYQKLFAQGEPTSSFWGEMEPKYQTAEFRNRQATTQEWSQPKVLYNETKEKYADHFVECLVMAYSTDEATAQEIAETKAVLKTYLEEAIPKFVLGLWDIDNDWDKFQKELKNIGLESYLQTIQSAYSKQYGN